MVKRIRLSGLVFEGGVMRNASRIPVMIGALIRLVHTAVLDRWAAVEAGSARARRLHARRLHARRLHARRLHARRLHARMLQSRGAAHGLYLHARPRRCAGRLNPEWREVCAARRDGVWRGVAWRGVTGCGGVQRGVVCGWEHVVGMHN